ncbi:hypothetical protein [Yoonia sp. BS5-3]|uniref:PAS domain-containing protein n=1 Tax=Yoonia phaeophyticola TaxID=3137369 RepID=A0ABZ2V3H7_9RHOB
MKAFEKMNLERSAAEFAELSDAEIVALAYKLSAGTERYNALFHALTTRLDNAAGPQPDAPPPDEVVASSLSQLEPHFENATDLLHDVLERKEKPKHSVRSMESDLRPCMLVSATGRLNYVNRAARQQFDVTIGDYLSQIHFEPGHFARFNKALIEPLRGR